MINHSALETMKSSSTRKQNWLYICRSIPGGNKESVLCLLTWGFLRSCFNKSWCKRLDISSSQAELSSSLSLSSKECCFGQRLIVFMLLLTCYVEQSILFHQRYMGATSYFFFENKNKTKPFSPSVLSLNPSIYSNYWFDTVFQHIIPGIDLI